MKYYITIEEFIEQLKKNIAADMEEVQQGSKNVEELTRILGLMGIKNIPVITFKRVIAGQESKPKLRPQAEYIRLTIEGIQEADRVLSEIKSGRRIDPHGDYSI